MPCPFPLNLYFCPIFQVRNLGILLDNSYFLAMSIFYIQVIFSKTWLNVKKIYSNKPDQNGYNK